MSDETTGTTNPQAPVGGAEATPTPETPAEAQPAEAPAEAPAEPTGEETAV